MRSVITHTYSFVMFFNKQRKYIIYSPGFYQPMTSGVFALALSCVFIPEQLLYMQFIQQIDISFSCVCPLTDPEFHHNIVKVAVDT